MSARKYLNLFNQFARVDDVTNLISKNVYEVTHQMYNQPNTLVSFDKNKYKSLYKKWGELGIFNHKENEISPLTYGMINYNIEKIDSSLRSAYSVQSSLVIHGLRHYVDGTCPNERLRS